MKLLDHPFWATKEVVANAKGAGVNLNFEKFNTHTHLFPHTFDELDHIYIEHFQGNGNLWLVKCFNVCKDGAHCEKFGEYLQSVMNYLMGILVTDNFKNQHSIGCPCSVGVEVVSKHLQQLFCPFQGQINFPLATKSMFDDLRTSIIVDGGVISQV